MSIPKRNWPDNRQKTVTLPWPINQWTGITVTNSIFYDPKHDNRLAKQKKGQQRADQSFHCSDPALPRWRYFVQVLNSQDSSCCGAWCMHYKGLTSEVQAFKASAKGTGWVTRWGLIKSATEPQSTMLLTNLHSSMQRGIVLSICWCFPIAMLQSVLDPSGRGVVDAGE